MAHDSWFFHNVCFIPDKIPWHIPIMMVQVMSGGCISSGSVAKTCCGHDRCPKTSGPATYETKMFSWRKEKCFIYIIMLVGHHMHICIIFIPWHCNTLHYLASHYTVISNQVIPYHIISYVRFKMACADEPISRESKKSMGLSGGQTQSSQLVRAEQAH